jgi:DNA-binding LacI/PurR family transcriptional regulator
MKDANLPRRNDPASASERHPTLGRRATLRDVAAAAGVSRTTASDALNGKGRVEPSTRLRVEETAQRLGYKSNPSARGLRSGRTGIVALIFPTVGAQDHGEETIGLDYYMHLASAVSAVAFTHDRAVVLVPPVRRLEDLRSFPIDGAIICDPEHLDPRAQLLDHLGLPLVTIERDLSRSDPWYVASDNAGNARQVLDHLAEAGAQRIALVVPQVNWAWQTETVAAYRRWTAERDRPSQVVPTSAMGPEGSAYAATLELLEGPNPPDAIFALAERSSTGVLRAAAARGKSVPGDLLVVAGVDSHQAREGEPSVTSIDLRPDELAAAAVRMLIGRLDGEPVDAPVIMDSALHLRASTRR